MVARCARSSVAAATHRHDYAEPGRRQMHDGRNLIVRSEAEVDNVALFRRSQEDDHRLPGSGSTLDLDQRACPACLDEVPP